MSGLTVLPVCPTCLSWSIYPASTAALEADTVAPISLATASNAAKFSADPIPLPPDTRILASEISTLLAVSLTIHFRSI